MTAATSTPTAAPAASDIPIVGPAIDAVTAPVQAVAGFAAWIADPHNVTRIVYVVGGLVAVVVGLRIVADSGVGGPVGAAARGVKGASDVAGNAVGVVTDAAVIAGTGGAGAVAKAGGVAAKAAKAAKAVVK